MAEETKPRLTRAERLEREREANLKYWEEQDALLFKHRQEAYDIGGAAQAGRANRSMRQANLMAPIVPPACPAGIGLGQ